MLSLKNNERKKQKESPINDQISDNLKEKKRMKITEG